MNVNVNCSEYIKNSQRDTHVLKVLTIQRKEQMQICAKIQTSN